MKEDENVRFAEAASPHSWLMTADNLHSQALLLSRSLGQSRLTYVDHRDGSMTWWDGANRGMFLLGGFALENALKAFLVYENPSWVSNGRLGGPLRSHSLTKLQGMVRDVPYKGRLVWVLREFEDGIESWSRYPCALTAQETQIEARMTKSLWVGYLRVMNAYGNRLRKMMSSGLWRGPHGVEGRWHFFGEAMASEEGMGRQGFKAFSASEKLKPYRPSRRG